MKREIKEIKKGIVRITTVDERWYVRQKKNEETGLPEDKFVPSVTWICSYYPKGVAFWKWLASHGWDEAEAIKQAAGDKGSKVHYASEDILLGKEVKMTDKYLNPTSGEPEELTKEEYECLMSLVGWLEPLEIEVIAIEKTEFNDEHGYAGTVDLMCRIDNQLWIVDLKTSANIWPSHKLQISAYSHLDIDYKELGITKDEWTKKKLGILQLGYRRNRRGYKLSEIKDEFDLFLAAKKIWWSECKNVRPLQRDYPVSLCVKKLKQKEGR